MSEIHKVGPYQITLALPASVSVRWDIVRAYNSNPDRAFAAALVCRPGWTWRCPCATR